MLPRMQRMGFVFFSAPAKISLTRKKGAAKRESDTRKGGKRSAERKKRGGHRGKAVRVDFFGKIFAAVRLFLPEYLDKYADCIL